MSNENLKLSLSAIMDNTADELELRRFLANADDSVMATWSRYQIARSVIRKEVIFPQLDLVSVVNEAIAKEDTPQTLVATEKKMANKQRKKSNLLLHIGKFAVAASILAVTLSSVYFFNNDDSDNKLGSLAQSDQATTDIKVATNDQWVEQRLSNFVDRHEQQGVLTIDGYDQAVDSTDTVTN